MAGAAVLRLSQCGTGIRTFRRAGAAAVNSTKPGDAPPLPHLQEFRVVQGGAGVSTRLEVPHGVFLETTNLVAPRSNCCC
ncbi:hypothetical protein GCM10017714_31330 [Curtobacterium pusillum]|nr:hypothetical protein GCM10017610_21180 [Curtobacterium pusillum]